MVTITVSIMISIGNGCWYNYSYDNKYGGNLQCIFPSQSPKQLKFAWENSMWGNLE